MKIWDWLTVLFVGLKLAEVITWSWWLVLAPTLIPLGIVVLSLLGLGVIEFLEHKRRKKK